jgi:hypothetical protein
MIQPAVCIATVLLLTGCSADSGLSRMFVPKTSSDSAASAPASTTQPEPLSDPLIQFARQATPGQESRIVLPETGQAVSVRLNRVYFASSGHNCREVLLGSNAQQQTRVVCEIATDQWIKVRSLLNAGPIYQ